MKKNKGYLLDENLDEDLKKLRKLLNFEQMIASKQKVEYYIKEFGICKKKRKELIMKLECNNYSSSTFGLMMTVYFTLLISIMTLIINLVPNKALSSLLILGLAIFAMFILFVSKIVMKIDRKSKLLIEILKSM